MREKSELTTEKILYWLLEGMCDLLMSSRRLYRWQYDQMYRGYLDDIDKTFDKKLRQRVSRYRKRGWVVVSETKGRRWLTLSDKGKKKLMDEKIKNVRFAPEIKWDGVWRVIIYDLGDIKAVHRYKVMRTFLRWGFCHVQKSVFVFPHACDKEVRMVAEFYELGKSVWIFEAIKTDNSEALKKFFHIED